MQKPMQILEMKNKVFSKILYPTEFSEQSTKAIEYVKKLKEAGTIEVIVLHVIDEHELNTMVEGCGWIGEDITKCLKGP